MAIDKAKMSEIIGRYDEIVSMLSDPSVAADSGRFVELTKDLGELTPKYEACMTYNKMLEQKKEALDMLEQTDDKEMHELALMELNDANEQLEKLDKELVLMLSPKDPRDDRSVILEIRAGAGGEEAALFAGILFRMYRQFAANHGYTIEIIDMNETELGGIKELVAEIDGRGAYSKLKFESGVHRVQRVPVTESGGRIHTSTATVAVLPKAEKSEVNIDMKDVRVDVFRSSGAGGQHINKTSSAIRMTHIPTGIVVTCQDERSQFQNKEKCLAVLQSRLWEMESRSAKNAEDSERRSQVGTGDRSERIRTYNYHEQRVTDHRIGLTLYKLEEILNGSLDEFIDALTVASAKIKPEEGQDNEEN